MSECNKYAGTWERFYGRKTEDRSGPDWGMLRSEMRKSTKDLLRIGPTGQAGCGRRSRTFISAFSAQRATDYTIPQQLLFCITSMAPGEGVEPSSLDSKYNVLPVTPSRNFGALGLEPRTLR